MTIIERIEELLAKGLTKAKIEATLTLDDYSKAEIAKAFKELGVTKDKPKSFKSEYYDWLAKAPRSREEAEAYILGQGEYGETSSNVQNHKSAHLGVWDLTIKVWASKGESAGQKAAPEPESDPVKEAWDNLKAELKKPRPAKSRVHPDKVAHLNNEELTRAYTEAFQDLNKGPRSSRKAA